MSSDFVEGFEGGRILVAAPYSSASLGSAGRGFWVQACRAFCSTRDADREGGLAVGGDIEDVTRWAGVSRVP